MPHKSCMRKAKSQLQGAVILESPLADASMRTRVDQDEERKLAEEQCGHMLARDEKILYALLTDMTPDGDYVRGWVLLTTRRLIACSETGTEPNCEIPVESIIGLEIRHFVGNGLLEVRTKEEVVKLARFSRSYARDFEKAVLEMEDHLKKLDKTSEFQPAAHPFKSIPRDQLDEEPNRCPKCGRYMRHGMCPYCLDKGKLFKRLLRYLKPYIPQAIVSTLLLVISGFLSMVQPYLTGKLVDEVLIIKDLNRLRMMVFILGSVHLTNAAIGGVRSYIITWLGQKVIRDMRSEVFHHLQYLRMEFYDSVRTGAIMSRTTSDTERLQSFVVQSSQNLIYELVMCIGVGIFLFTYDWRLALVTLVPMPLIVTAAKVFSNNINRVYRRIWVRYALMNSVLADAIPGIQVVKSFAQEKREIAKFDKRSDELFDRYVDAAKFRSLFVPFLSFATSIGTLIIWGYGGYLVIRTSSLTIGDLVAFLYYLNQFYNPLRGLSAFSDVIQRAATSAERVFEILDSEPEVKHEESKIKLAELKGEIEFKDVYFSYEADEPVLEEINVKIEPGEMIGLVGSSGSGKTTMVNLIPRLYDVTAGSILIDGHDIKELDLRYLRNQIGVVLQDPLLFHGTIAENIAYGVPNASREDIIWAAQAANAHDFIMEFPDKYDTHTGERGLRLSGGQKQRISIARAILKNPRILILDEATSSVDSETEKLIQEAIDRLVQNRTTIAIAHRLSTLKNADRILVLEKGRIVEQGTHDELMRLDGIFARLVKMQSEVSRNIAV